VVRGFLTDDRNALSVFGEIVFGNGDAINKNLTSNGIIKSLNQCHRGRLSASRRANEGNIHSRLDIQIQSPQNRDIGSTIRIVRNVIIKVGARLPNYLVGYLK
jgi:hypothetical protein